MSVRICFATESLAAKDSGIGRVARLCARVIAEKVQQGECSMRLLALNDSESLPDWGEPTIPARGSRLRFVWEANQALLSCTHFLYDFLGMARAHNKLPWPRRPFMVWIHGIEVWPGSDPNRLIVAKQAQRLVVNTHYSRQRAADYNPIYADARVCWLATETDDPLPPRSIPPKQPTVLILGRMDTQSYKGHPELIACWPKIVDKIPDARLVIAGGGPGRDVYQALAASSPVSHRIEFRGFVPEDNMSSLWQETSVLAMPSRGEGFGLVYIEAMRQGIPVIASIHDAAQEVNVHSETGFNVDLDQPDELPHRILQLLEQESLALKLGQQGQQRWSDHFTYRAFQQRFAPILDEFLRTF